ncbi:sensor histidine kinase [Roseateles sp. LKC17W]|uniref:Sensor histidine kinase n=1 Tax=Pelomonas margarita TaxID=3299031 RepID=A0ABW7FGB5_9BURK
MTSPSRLSRWLATDCSQWFYPGPRRSFTPEEMARGGSQPWPTTLDRYALFNAVVLLSAGFVGQPPLRAGLQLGLGLLLTGVALAGARSLWRHPTRARLNLYSYVGGLSFMAALALALRVGDRETIKDALPHTGWVFVAVISAWWALTVFRAHQIDARLRELDEQDAALRLSTRLAAAQIQPHFLFNTLASLQHWVDTGDARAAPLLRDFTGYLRATLPMFEREQQPLADEMAMVQRYLAIMQARLGRRLGYTLDIAPDVAATELPPGLVLTLVENAIAHGIEPQLSGGHVTVRAARDGGAVRIQVADDGPGLAPGWRDGVGLANTRRRLHHAQPLATLALTDHHPGCLATLTLPHP